MIPIRYLMPSGMSSFGELFLSIICGLMLFSTQNLYSQCEAKAAILGIAELSQSGTENIFRTDIEQPAQVPSGYLNWYALSNGEDLIIHSLSPEPAFKISGTGIFTIHSLVFDPETFDISSLTLGTTQASEIFETFIQGGGNICGAIDMTGSALKISKEESICGAFPGIYREGANTCLGETSALLSAEAIIAPLIPEGFDQVFLLARGNGEIVDYNFIPEFVLPLNDSIVLHSFVYDTTAFNVDSLIEDQKTIIGIDSLLQQGGGQICGALDTGGLLFYSNSCTFTCAADAGTLQAGQQVCLSDGTKQINASIADPPVQPDGFALTYLLSSGNNQTIRGLSNTPSFILEGEGAFRIHTLVYDSSALNLDTVIRLGTTNTAAVLDLLIAGNGDICGAIDLEGISLELGDCPCLAEFGTLEPSDACLNSNGAVLEATVNTQAKVPTGYKQIFILTSGDELVIEEFMNEPYFEVEGDGKFAIHNLVYNPGSLPIGFIQLGHTTLGFLNSFLIQGGGDICAALDMTGAVFEVEPCKDELQVPTAFPNPAKDQINIIIPSNLDQKEVLVQLIDAYGNLVASRKAGFGLDQIEFDTSILPEGLYSIRTLYNDGRVGISKVYIVK